MGIHKAIASPELLLQYFNEYVEWVKSNPIKKHVFVGKDGTSDYEERQRPLTMEGFECYLFKLNIASDLKHYFANTDNRYSNFSPICTHIKREIRNEQIAGGMAGIYNTSITQRLNGLVEKSEQKITTTEIKANFGN